jgi:hypothetical protein
MKSNELEKYEASYERLKYVAILKENDKLENFIYDRY